MKLRNATMVVVFLAAVALASCTGPNEAARVSIEYDQLANFPIYKTDPNSTSSYGLGLGLGLIFVLYKIHKITNTRDAAADFLFLKDDPSTVTSEGTDSSGGTSNDLQLLGAGLVDHLTVSAGQVVVDPGCIILLAHVDQLPLGSLVNLQHDVTAKAQPVTMTRVPSDTTTAIIDIGLPSTVQNLCAGLFRLHNTAPTDGMRPLRGPPQGHPCAGCMGRTVRFTHTSGGVISSDRLVLHS